MKYYYDELQHILNNTSIKYIEYIQYIKYYEYYEYSKFCNYMKSNIKSTSNIIFFDPIDKINIINFQNNYNDITSNNTSSNHINSSNNNANNNANNNKFIVLPTPNFLLSRENLIQYHQKTDKFFFNAFYMWAKNINNIIPSVKSHDRENRMCIPENYIEPKLTSMNININEYNKYINEAVKYVEDKFPHNHGNSTSQFIYPIDRKSALKWLDEFIAHKLSKFGNYQDFIIKEKHYLNHSILSSSINIGLINPSDILDRLRKLNIKSKIPSKIPMNSYEGYIRQLYWREYQRICYIYLSDLFEKNNYFGNHGKLSSDWYSGKLGCPPVDDAIIDGFDTGYLHHIRRLMIVGNYMMLNGISPNEGFKWFMEFSIDSYEWVMYQNVYDMVFCCTGGKTMRKPYISSSSYILKMSNYEKGDLSNNWTEKWNDLYHNFLKKNKEKMQKFRYYFGKFY